MTTATAITFGALGALLVAALFGLGILIRFVDTDVDRFVKWLDSTDQATS